MPWLNRTTGWKLSSINWIWKIVWIPVTVSWVGVLMVAFCINELWKLQRFTMWILHPYILSSKSYPVGHPEIVTRDFADLSSYFGLAKVKVIPPRGLFHPVLGYRTGGKLTFPLCRTCVECQQQESCTCTESQRSWIGTYCTPELEKAIEKGY